MAGIASHLAGIGIAAIIGFSVVLPYTQRDLPITVVNYSLVNPEVAQGATLLVDIDLDFSRPNCQMTTDSSLFYGPRPSQVDEREALVSAGSGIVGERHFVRPYKLPEDAALGEARLETTFTFQCSWIDHLAGPMVLQLPDLDFRVTEPQASNGDQNG